MSGTKRTPIGRPSRHPPLTAAAIALFAALEDTPRQRRSSLAFKNNEHELARMLNLIPEWWAGCTVLDDSAKPPWPPWLAAYEDWHRVRAVRKALLEACKAVA